MRILVVDDEITYRLILQKILSPYGIIHTAANGREALEAFIITSECCQPYDLITLDLLMPEMNGIEVLREIRAMEDRRGITGKRRTKIIIATSVDDATHVLSACKEQCEAYIVKPLIREQVVATLHMLEAI